MKIDIRSLSEDKLCEFFENQGFESYRGKQVYEWIWKKSSHTFDNMTNISKEVRQLELGNLQPLVDRLMPLTYQENPGSYMSASGNQYNLSN